MRDFTLIDAYKVWSEYGNDCEHTPQFIAYDFISIHYCLSYKHGNVKLKTATYMCSKCRTFSYQDPSFEAHDIAKVEGM